MFKTFNKFDFCCLVIVILFKRKYFEMNMFKINKEQN